MSHHPPGQPASREIHNRAINTIATLLLQDHREVCRQCGAHYERCPHCAAHDISCPECPIGTALETLIHTTATHPQ